LNTAELVLQHLGGRDNLVRVTPVQAHLRVELKDASLVDEAALKSLGAYGVVISGRVVQVVLGAKSGQLAAEISAATG